MQGIIYTNTGNRARGQVTHYHGKPSALNLSKTPHRVDIAGLKSTEQRDVLMFDGVEYGAKFTIGFEIEKTALHRSAVKEYPLFCGFERDGSCGYEAVTHILPLLPAGQWRTKVFDLFVQAEKIIDNRYSPSDSSCGGHITVVADGMGGDELRKLIRKNVGIIYALFRNRLKNHFCNHNRRMESQSEFTNGRGCGGWHHKYHVALVKDTNGNSYNVNGKLLEFRLPSRVESVKQMMRRYELMYEIVNFSVNNPNGSHDALLKKVRPIVMSMYNGDVAKVEEIYGYAKHFRKFILTGDIHQDIAPYL